MIRKYLLMKIKFKFCLFALIPLMALHALDEKEAESIGTEVYIYGYPLVTSEMTRTANLPQDAIYPYTTMSCIFRKTKYLLSKVFGR